MYTQDITPHGKVILTLLRLYQLQLDTVLLPHWVLISPIPSRRIACMQCVGCSQLECNQSNDCYGRNMTSDTIGTSQLSHTQWTKWLQFTVSLSSPHFLNYTFLTFQYQMLREPCNWSDHIKVTMNDDAHVHMYNLKYENTNTQLRWSQLLVKYQCT